MTKLVSEGLAHISCSEPTSLEAGQTSQHHMQLGFQISNYSGLSAIQGLLLHILEKGLECYIVFPGNNIYML